MASDFIIRLSAVAMGILIFALLAREAAYLNKGYTIGVVFKQHPFRPGQAPPPATVASIAFPAWRKVIPFVLGGTVLISLILLMFQPKLSLMTLIATLVVALCVCAGDVIRNGYIAAPMAPSTVTVLCFLTAAAAYLSFQHH